MVGMAMALPSLPSSRVSMQGLGVEGDQGTSVKQVETKFGPNTISNSEI
jgi:hypothetical protein